EAGELLPDRPQRIDRHDAGRVVAELREAGGPAGRHRTPLRRAAGGERERVVAHIGAAAVVGRQRLVVGQIGGRQIEEAEVYALELRAAQVGPGGIDLETDRSAVVAERRALQLGALHDGAAEDRRPSGALA